MHIPSQYNALNLFHQGNRARMDEAWERHRDWSRAWDEARHGSRIDPDREWERLMKRDIRLVTHDDPNYPPFLREIHSAPYALYILGTFCFEQPLVAVVGTRRATHAGLETACAFARGLSDCGVGVVSGLALGIDGAAHRGALESGKRPTIAVLPSGLDRVYPSSHAPLAREILAHGGALVSEYPFDSPTFPSHFLERNRIVSCLSRGTLVVEAPERSGALVTARLATEQNRDVFAVPGPLSHPNYAGSHALIRQGAELVTSSRDICMSLGIPFAKPSENAPDDDMNLSPHERAVLAAIRAAGAPLTLDEIAELGHLEVHLANQAVALLTVNGMIRDMNGRYSL